MTDEILFPETPFPLSQALIFLGRRGSEAFDLVTDKGPDRIQDRDLIGICVPPVGYYFGLHQWEGAEKIREQWDVVLFEVKKFVRLLMQQNPNVLECIWTDESDVLSRSVEGTVLYENRELFRHEGQARARFLGYARGQLEKMEAFDAATMQVIDTLEKKLLENGIDPLHVIADPPIRVALHLRHLADDYRRMRQRYKKAYMGAKRWEMVRKVGYDAKNAGHLIRLLHMGYEYLTTGRLQVKRTWDREMLLEIKRGEWALSRVKAHAEEWFSKVEQAKSRLPVGIDETAVENLLLYIITNRLDLQFRPAVIAAGGSSAR